VTHVKGSTVDKIVLAALDSWRTADRETRSIFEPQWPPKPLERVPYGYIGNEVWQALYSRYQTDAAVYTAVHRTVHRLAAQGRLIIHERSPGRIGWVELVKAM
jgi:hypothetical protein